MAATTVIVGSAQMGSVQAQDAQGNEVSIHWAEGNEGPKKALRPMEMILAGLGGCMLVTCWPILQKMRQPVAAYEIRVEGERASEPPRVFTRIHMEHRFRGAGLDPQKVERAVELAEGYCSASAMLSRAVPITHPCAILEEE